MNRQFIMELRVDDKQQLLQAATVRAIEEGNVTNQTEAHDLLCPGGEPNVGACLIMLLDPGTLPGCSIHESRVE